MAFISHAQNLEDVMLWRALRDVENGFYIDVGAYDPDLVSVTKALYDLGWRGINIEPMRHCFERLCASRPRDVNLNIAIGDKEATLDYYEIPNSGSSTFNATIASPYREQGREVIEQKVSVLTLSEICRRHAPHEIHFLKIDVEGMELAVLQGMDFSLYRPWIVVMEAISPLTQGENYMDWEFLLAQNGYKYAYFDGINRFYLAVEHDNLSSHFRAPPNFLDGFVTAAQHQAETQAASVSAQLERLKVEAASAAGNHRQQLESAQNELEAYRHELKTITGLHKQSQTLAEERSQELREVYASLSWRLTAFLRFGNALVQRFWHGKTHLRAAGSDVVVRAARYITPRRMGLTLLRPISSIQRRIRSIALNKRPSQLSSSRPGKHTSTHVSPLSGDENLTPEAQAILVELKAQLRLTQESMPLRTERRT